MARKATIGVQNNTGFGMSLTSQDARHGKINDIPQGIGNGHTGNIIVTTNTDSKIGPEGHAIYIINDTNSTTIKIYWHHPWHGQSTYWGQPSNTDAYLCAPSKADPEHPKGHTQSLIIQCDDK